ncbi:hypothetical protein ACFV9G_29400 [Nocardioides sp. NPDC059952]|uniref:hypothetical protein n=1 Tax=Nocardioides sp. NPDC059952 TaxID=3347014 RepID=UPI00365A65CE
MEWTLTQPTSPAVLRVRLAAAPGRYTIFIADPAGTEMVIAQAIAFGSFWRVRALVSHHVEAATTAKGACQALLADVHELFPGARLTPALTKAAA